jgi:hypothetical protein
VTSSFQCNACGREWQDHPGVEPTCKLAIDLALTLKEVLTYAEPPKYTRDITEQEIYFDLIERARRLIVKSRHFSQ